ncbi:hypothetical protein V1264_012941 [Littorina saxatilis]|uniref:RNA-directed DNA polymerase n=1 Tax=Littorina saxatilis TaxID=31220 RepID=A0AAN9GET6_9CAEN
MAMNIPSVGTFDPKGEPSQVAARWQKWQRGFEIYLTALGDTTDVQKRALLLHCVGAEVQDIFHTFSQAQAGTTCAHTLKAFSDYFTPKQNPVFERHLFRQMNKEEGESTLQFVTRLRQQAEHCGFGDLVEQQIRDHAIEKTTDRRLKAKLLEKGDLTLTQLLAIARVHEAAVSQVQAMDIHSKQSGDGLVGAVGGKQHQGRQDGAMKHRNSKERREKQRLCFRCGMDSHFASDEQCPARGKKCRSCSLVGHFSRCCKTKRKDKPKNSSVRRVAGHAEDSDSTSSDSDESTFAVHNAVKQNMTSITCGGVDLKVMIDSGASCNIIGKSTWKKLKEKQIRYTAKGKTDKKLFVYGSAVPLKLKGKFQTEVSFGPKNIMTEFIVLDGEGESLIGLKTAQDLGVLQINVHTVKEGHDTLFEGLGKLKNFQAHLYLKEDVKPVAQPPRRIPFGLREKLEEKIAELEAADIIEKVDGPTPWVSPVVVVPKPNGDIRVCVDMRRANEAVERQRYPIPTVEETLLEMNGSTVFSKLDLKWGFHQLELDEESRSITTFATHNGLYRYRRLMFGISSAPELYQHTIQQVLQDCEGAKNMSDDIIIHGRDIEEHDVRLEKVLKKLEDSGLTLNREKCVFRMKQLEFLGFILNEKGVSPSLSKVQDVRDARRPETAAEVRSFLGLVNFNAKFIKCLASKAEPLRKLTRKNAPFKWEKAQEEAFNTLKNDLAEAATLAYFDSKAETRIVADAGPCALGAVLTQKQKGEDRVICYASRSLSETERRYSQTEKEALALVWACERFHQYVFGVDFILETDHRPLEFIYSKRSKPSARIERWVLRLQTYNFKVQYKPGSQNIADSLSRLVPKNSHECGNGENVAEEYIRFIAKEAVPAALSPQEVEKASADDIELEAVRSCIESDNWETCPLAYRAIKSELTCLGKLVIRGTRLVIPLSLRQRVVDLAHEGHQGIVKTKQRLRSKVWWPGVDSDTERKCRTCHDCQIVSQPCVPEPMTRTKFPDGPWEDLSLDILGPLPTGHNLVVIVDYFTRYFEVMIVKTVTSEQIIKGLEQIFARHGLPHSLRSDNGPQFVSDEFENYLSEQGIEHRKTTPLWPQANGEVERQNRTLLKNMQIAHSKGQDWREELPKFLLAYRSTPHSTTGVSPAELLFNRQIRTKLPQLKAMSRPEAEGTRDRDATRKMKEKLYGDAKRHATECDTDVGDEVLLKQKHQNKFSTTFESSPYRVVERNGNQVVVQSPDGRRVRRNISFTRPYLRPEPSVEEPATPTVEDAENPSVEVRRSGRQQRPPDYLKDYVVD